MSPATAADQDEGGSARGAERRGAPPAIRERYYRQELDWLRFLAFWMVFTLHAFPTAAGGYTSLGVPRALAETVFAPLAQAGGYGVDLFFVLSAFLITELLLREKEAAGRVHVRSFYVRRILRIWPLYVTFVLAVLPYEVIWKEVPLAYFGALLAFAGNWYVVWFGGFSGYKSLCGNLWTVSIEEQFYLIWPHLLGRIAARWFPAVLVALLCFTWLFRFVWIQDSPRPIAVWYHTFTRLDGFALGGLLAWRLHGRTLRLPAVARLALAVGAMALFWTIGRSPYGGYFGSAPLWSYPLAASASVLLLLAFLGCGPARPGRLLRTLSYLGKISYGLYVFHGPALKLSRFLLGVCWPSPRWPWPWQMLLGGAITVAVATLSYELLEKPFLRWKRRFTFVESRPT